MKKKSILVFVLFSILLISFLSFVVAAQTEDELAIIDFFKTPVIKQIIGIVFGLWDVDKAAEYYAGPATQASPSNISWLNRITNSEPINAAGGIIVYLVIWGILFLAFANIISTFSPFDEWVGWLIGLGLVIAAAQLKTVYVIASWMAEITSYFGAISAFIGIIMSFVAFIGVSIGATSFRKWAVKRQLAIAGIKAMKGTAKSVEGLKTLKDIGTEVAKP